MLQIVQGVVFGWGNQRGKPWGFQRRCLVNNCYVEVFSWTKSKFCLWCHWKDVVLRPIKSAKKKRSDGSPLWTASMAYLDMLICPPTGPFLPSWVCDQCKKRSLRESTRLLDFGTHEWDNTGMHRLIVSVLPTVTVTKIWWDYYEHVCKLVTLVMFKWFAVGNDCCVKKFCLKAVDQQVSLHRWHVNICHVLWDDIWSYQWRNDLQPVTLLF